MGLFAFRPRFWVQSRRDPAAVLADYAALCGRDGLARFARLVAPAGLAFPFTLGALKQCSHRNQLSPAVIQRRVPGVGGTQRIPPPSSSVCRNLGTCP
jgi:hypothetical protein